MSQTGRCWFWQTNKTYQTHCCLVPATHLAHHSTPHCTTYSSLAVVEVAEALGLDYITNRAWHCAGRCAGEEGASREGGTKKEGGTNVRCAGTVATTGDGIYDALDWMVNQFYPTDKNNSISSSNNNNSNSNNSNSNQ